MRNQLLRVTTFSVTLVIGLCAYELLKQSEAPTPSIVGITIPTAPNAPKRTADCEVLSDFVEADKLTYGDFQIVRRHKKVQLDWYPNEKPLRTEVSFAELKHGKKTLASFDGVYHALGNLTDFGMFRLLGKDERQLVVQQTIPRTGNHWIWDLNSDLARKIYDSADWGVGREDLCVGDVDDDGIMEISQEVTAFCGLMDKFAMAWIPLTPVFFKYDPQSQRYLPASHKLDRSFVITTDENEAMSSRDPFEQSLIVHSLLEYVFAGQREKGWALFERNYRGDDKDEMRKRIQAILKEQPVYRYIYRL